MGVTTGTKAYVDYAIESTFGTALTATRAFGMNESVTNFKAGRNQQAIWQLGKQTSVGFTHGAIDGSFGMNFVLSNPWWFDLILGSRAKSGSGTDFTHTFTTSGTPRTANIKVGMALSGGNRLYSLEGCVLQTASLSTAIDGMVDCNLNFAYGDYSNSTTIDTTPVTDDISFPYMFHHATLEIPNGTTFAEVQSVDLEINTGAGLHRQLGTNKAVGAYNQKLEVTGKFTVAMTDYTLWKRVLEGAEYGTAKVKFTNGSSGNAERTIELQFTGCGFSESSTSVKTGEPIWEDINFQCREMTAVLNNSTSAVP